MVKDEKNRKEKTNLTISLQLIGLAVFNAVHSAYMINYKPKIGAYHVWLCTVIGLMIIVFCAWSIVNSVKILTAGERKRGYIIIVLVLTSMLLVMGADSTLPYCKDLMENSKSITANSYLVIRDHLSFQDDEGKNVTIQIPADKADELRAKENYGYDQENNLLKHYDSVTVTYYPNSKVLLEIR